VTAWVKGDRAVVSGEVVEIAAGMAILRTDALPDPGLVAVPVDRLSRPAPPPAASHTRMARLLDQVNNLARELAGAEHGREAGLAEIGRRFLTILEGP
jgi:hypothetical protein